MSGRGKLPGAPIPRIALTSRHRRALAALVVSLKFAVPSLMVQLPFAGAWGTYVLNGVNGDVLLELGVSEEAYQTIDKTADYFSYVVMLIVGLRWRTKRLIVLLFVYRTIGQALFFKTRNELAFVSFPNFMVRIEAEAGVDREDVATAVRQRFADFLARQGLANVAVAASHGPPWQERSGKFRQVYRQRAP
jgi:hypothetical protein